MYNYSEKKYFSVDEEANILPEELREYYKNTQLDRIVIDGNEIQGYFEYSNLDEKTYNKQPQRTLGGVVDLANHTSFLTSRIVIKFKYMHIEDYRRLIKLMNSKNVFNVTFYDIISDSRVTKEMYFAPQKMPLLHQLNLQLLGVRDMEVELIGTNRNIKQNKVTFDFNAPALPEGWSYSGDCADVGKTKEKYFYANVSDRVTASFTSGDYQMNIASLTLSMKNASGEEKTYKFEKWNTQKDGSGLSYINDDAYLINEETTLYAIWRQM